MRERKNFIDKKLYVVQTSSMKTLKQYLAHRNEKAADFARRAKLTPSTVSRAINGRVRLPSHATLEAIRTATKDEVTPNDFLNKT